MGVGWSELLLLACLLTLPPLVDQCRRPAPRLDADAVEYYSHLRSLYFDHDLDFANEFAHFGLMTRWDKIQPTVTGHRRTIFSIGPALLWMPFYAAGDLVARLRGDVQDGYSPAHIRSVCLASLAYGVAGLLLVYGVLRTSVDRGAAIAAVLLAEYATFLYWYMAREPVMSHALSFFAAALVLALWWPRRRDLGLGRAALLGLAIGVAATVRWQNGVLLLLPAATLLPGLWARPRRAMLAGCVALLCFAAGASPQLFAWKAIFGRYLLTDPPHGRDFLRLGHPFLLETFFSSRHGLLYWTPILWGGYLGLLALWRRDRVTAAALLLPLAFMSYVNACSGDWWAGGSFSNRRFDSVLPILALGLAAGLSALVAWTERRPGSILVLCGAAFVVWNAVFMEQYREGMIPKDETVSFADVAGNNAALVARAVGAPLAWPANWIFAGTHALPPAQYDRASGLYLFYRQNNLGGLVAIGDARVDPALLGEGWGPRAPCDGATCREVRERARVLAPLDVPEELDVTVRARGSGTLSLAVNGAEVARFPLGPALADLRVRVAASRWHRELNELTLVAESQADVAALTFARTGASR